MDPFLDLIRLLRPRAMLWGGIEAYGQWGVSFRQRDDLLFCWIERGECQLTRPQHEPVNLRTDDFVLIRSVVPFSLTSDVGVEPIDSETAVAAAKRTKLRLGQGKERRVTVRAGRFLFDMANEDLLAGLLPSVVHIGASDKSSARVRALLTMNEAESREPGPASEFIMVRLMELILVEILRTRATGLNEQQSGLLAGLADPIVARSLSAMHQDVAHHWTVSNLAKLCRVSRSAFATRFRQVMGIGPIAYLLNWRMAVAKDELHRGTRSIGEIALAVGFHSSSAFSTSFTRHVGCSPKHFGNKTNARSMAEGRRET